MAVGAGVAAGLVTLAACVDLGSLGSGARPSLDASDDAEGSAADVAVEAGFCHGDDSSLFCDDFDDPGDAPAGARWLGVEGVAPGIIVAGEAGLSRGAGHYPAKSPPLSLDMFVDRTEGEQRAVSILNQVVRTSQAGVEAVAEVRIVDMLDKTDAAPTPDGGVSDPFIVSLLGMATVGATSVGASVWLNDSELRLAAGVQTSKVSRTGSAGVSFNFGSVTRASWVRVHLAMGEHDAVVARVASAAGASSVCPGTKAVAAAWASLPPGSAMCVALADDLVPLSEGGVAIILGMTADRPARARVQFDNVRVDAVPR